MTEDLLLYGGTYLNKGGAAIALGTIKALRSLNINFKDIIDPEPFFSFNSLSLHPIYRFSDVLSTKDMKSISPLSTYKPFMKCLLKSFDHEIKELNGLPIWHIGDSPFSDSRSALSVVGQIIALESLRKSIKSTTVIGGVSIDTPKTGLGRQLSKKCFKNYFFYVRGSYTLRNLLDLGVPRDKMQPISDFAFQLTKTRTNTTREIVSRIIGSGKPAIALCLRNYSSGAKKYRNIEVIKSLVSNLEKKYSVFFVPTTYAYLIPENDFIFFKDVLNVNEDRLINIRDLTPMEIIDVFSTFDVVISSRLHGAVYGALADTPTIHLYEGSKSLEVIGDVFGETIPLINLTEFLSDEGINKLLSVTDSILSNKDDLAKEIHRLRCNAQQNSLDMLKETIDSVIA